MKQYLCLENYAYWDKKTKVKLWNCIFNMLQPSLIHVGLVIVSEWLRENAKSVATVPSVTFLFTSGNSC